MDNHKQKNQDTCTAYRFIKVPTDLPIESEHFHLPLVSNAVFYRFAADVAYYHFASENVAISFCDSCETADEYMSNCNKFGYPCDHVSEFIIKDHGKASSLTYFYLDNNKSIYIDVFAPNTSIALAFLNNITQFSVISIPLPYNLNLELPEFRNGFTSSFCNTDLCPTEDRHKTFIFFYPLESNILEIVLHIFKSEFSTFAGERIKSLELDKIYPLTENITVRLSSKHQQLASIMANCTSNHSLFIEIATKPDSACARHLAQKIAASISC
jgi:hypothetical protein